MSVAAQLTREAPTLAEAHPNELDLRRIARAIEGRERYRYVKPDVSATTDGYLIRSACCSRNIDPDGGEIDIALIRWDAAAREYALLRRDHETEEWIEDSRYARLPELLLRLNGDPHRVFWQ